MGEVTAQSSDKSCSVEPNSVMKDMVKAENTDSKVLKIGQPLSTCEAVKKDSVQVDLSPVYHFCYIVTGMLFNIIIQDIFFSLS